MSADLFRNAVKYLDPHVALIVIEYYEENKFIDPKVVAAEKIAVLSKTRLYDYAKEELQKLKASQGSGDIDKLIEAAETKRKEEAFNMAKYEKLSQNFVQKVVNNKEIYDDLEKEKFNKTAFYKHFPSLDIFSKDDLDNSLRYARNIFDAGQYQQSNKILNCLLPLYEDDESLINILWGKFLSNILIESYNEAHEDVKQLKDKLEKDRPNTIHMQVLANRINFLHTILSLYLHNKFSDESLDLLVDIFSKENFINAVQVGAPYLMRYIGVSFLLLKNSSMFELSKLTSLLPFFHSEVSKYSDCVTEFILALLEDFDFKKAQEILKRFKKELDGDYFLHKHLDAIINNAQTLFFEVFCKIYRKIEIKNVAEFLGVDKEKAEVWIVNLIRNANFEAKIDPQNGVINLVSQKPTVYEQVLNKTRDLLPRTNILINNISRILKAQD